MYSYKHVDGFNQYASSEPISGNHVLSSETPVIRPLLKNVLKGEQLEAANTGVGHGAIMARNCALKVSLLIGLRVRFRFGRLANHPSVAKFH